MKKKVVQTLYLGNRLPSQRPLHDGDIVVVEQGRLSVFHWRSAPAEWRQLHLSRDLERDSWNVARKWVEDLAMKADLYRAFQIGSVSVWWHRYAFFLFHYNLKRGELFSWIDLLILFRNEYQIGSILLAPEYEERTTLVEEIFPGARVEVCDESDFDSPRNRRDVLRKLVVPAISRVINGFVSVLVMLRWLLRREASLLVFTASTNLRRTVAGDGTGHEIIKDVIVGDLVKAARAAGKSVHVIEKDMHSNVIGFSLEHRGLDYVSTLLFMLATVVYRHIASYRFSTVNWPEVYECTRQAARYRGYDVSFATDQILHFAKKYHPYFVALVCIWQRFLSWHRPEQILVSAAYGFEAHALSIAAKALRIPTIEIQHGLINDHHLAYVPPRTEFDMGLPRRLLAWGPRTREVLVAEGNYTADRVHVVGFPRLDPYVLHKNVDQNLRRTVREQLGICPGVPILLHTASYVTDYYCTKVDIVGALKELIDGGAQLVIKVHPTAKAMDIFGWVQAFEAHDVIASCTVVREEVDLYALLLAADIHISFSSTTVIEAAVLGRPNLILTFPGSEDPVGYVTDGGGVPVSLSTISRIASELLHDEAKKDLAVEAQQRFADGWCLVDHQSSVRRIIALLFPPADTVDIA